MEAFPCESCRRSSIDGRFRRSTKLAALGGAAAAAAAAKPSSSFAIEDPLRRSAQTALSFRAEARKLPRLGGDPIAAKAKASADDGLRARLLSCARSLLYASASAASSSRPISEGARYFMPSRWRYSDCSAAYSCAQSTARVQERAPSSGRYGRASDDGEAPVGG